MSSPEELDVVRRYAPGSVEVRETHLPSLPAGGARLGSDAYTWVRAALSERLAAVESQKDVAYSTDIDGFRHVES